MRQHYSVKVGDQRVGSPTDRLTDKPQFRACFDSLNEARAFADHYQGIVMVNPSDWRALPTEIVS